MNGDPWVPNVGNHVAKDSEIYHKSLKWLVGGEMEGGLKGRSYNVAIASRLMPEIQGLNSTVVVYL